MSDVVDEGAPSPTQPDAGREPATHDWTADPWPSPTWPPPGWQRPGASIPPRGANRLGLVPVIAFTLIAGLGIGVGVGIAARSTGSASPSALLIPTTSPSSSSPAAATPSTSASAVAAKVDPAIVDITTTLAGGQGTAAGTGMVVTSSGEVLTNNHVIADAVSITVQVAGTSQSYTATVLGYDVTSDVALLQLQGASGLATISVGNSSNVAVGDAVVALGNALGQGGTPAASTGVVTALGQTITASGSIGGSETLAGLIEMNASIQPGDSGGPLVDSSGNVIGMDTAAVSGGFRQASASTTAYAIPIDAAMSIVKQIESGTSTSTVHVGQRAILGVQMQDTTLGATVAGVETGSPAASAGIVAGDVIVSVDGTGVSSASALGSALQGRNVGDAVTVVWTDQAGSQHSAVITLIAGPPA
jgi:S1-C subfamily serine protease